MTRVVLDTYVLVSGLLNPFGPPGRILDLILAGEVTIDFDDRILSEYEEVLLRPRFGFDPGFVRILLDFLRRTGLPVSALPLNVEKIGTTDPDDLPFAEVAVAAAADALITGNAKDFDLSKAYPELVQSPADFLKGWVANKT